MSLEHPLNETIEINPNAWHWFMECAADTFKRFRIGTDGVTAYIGIRGREVDNPVSAFEGKVFYNSFKHANEARDRVDPAWVEGICLGCFCVSNGYIIGTHAGVIGANSVKRMPEGECWDARAIRERQGTPWRCVPGRSGTRTPAHVSDTIGEEKAAIEDDNDALLAGEEETAGEIPVEAEHAA